MSRERELAEAVREYFIKQSDPRNKWTKMVDMKRELEAMARQILDAPPPQQESATVADLRRWISCMPGERGSISIDYMRRLADTLEASEQNACNLAGTVKALQARVKELEQQAIESEVPISFGQKCYQDRCENAYVEASVVKMLEEEIAGLKAQLESAQLTASHLRECLMKTEEKLAEYAPPFTDEARQPAPSRKVDWDSMGLVAFQMHKTSRNSNWYELSEYGREEWRSVAKAVVAAHEANEEKSDGD